MKWIYEMADIEALEDVLPMEMTGYLRERFCELEKIYRDDGTPFALGEYGGIALVDSYDEIASLIFEEVIPENHKGMAFFRCVHIPNNETCVDYCVPVSILSLDQFRILLEDVAPMTNKAEVQ